MLQAVRQRFQVESGRLLRVVDLEDPDTGASDQQVDVVGAAPPGAKEGDSAENPEDLMKSSPDYYPGQSGDTYGFGNVGGSIASAMKSAYGGGSPYDQAGTTGGSSVGQNISPAAQEHFINTGMPATGATAQNPTGAPGTPGAAAGPGQPGAPVNTQALSGGADIGDVARALTLYNMDDPTTAVNSAIRALGGNPFNTGNPFNQIIQRAAPGLAAAFMLQNALGGQTGQSAADNPLAFRDFLTSSIAGRHVFGGLAGAASLIPQVVAKIREQANAGGNANEVNPFLNAIANVLGTGFGEGTTGVLQALLAPSMPRTLAGGYRSGLERALSNAQYNYPYEQTGPGGPDIWKFLLGV